MGNEQAELRKPRLVALVGPRASRALAIWVLVLGAGACCAAAAQAGVGGHVVVARTSIRDRLVLLRLVRGPRSFVGDPALRFAGLTPAMTGLQSHQATAHAAARRRPRLFPILDVGYLRRRDYDEAVGRLYAVSADGHSLSACTGTVVSARLVLTAAHCVYDLQHRRKFAGFLFVPGLRGTSAPAGVWTGSSAAYWSRWVKSPTIALDYGFVTLDPNQQGQNIGSVTGYHRIVEYARPRRVFAEGYPASGPFRKKCTLTSCVVTYCYSPLGGVFPGASGNVLGIGCVTGHGASGGPWFVRFHGQAAIASVTAIGIGSRGAHYFRVIFGPQFDSRLERLAKAAEGA